MSLGNYHLSGDEAREKIHALVVELQQSGFEVDMRQSNKEINVKISRL